MNASYLEIAVFYRFLQARQKLPKYLQHLLSLTPSGEMKLIAVWDGLTNESQIQILECLSATGAPVMPKLCYQALESGIPYVRYLATKQLGDLPTDWFSEQTNLSNDEIKEIYDSYIKDETENGFTAIDALEDFQMAYKVCADPSPLVRGASCERATPLITDTALMSDLLLTNEEFFNLSQDNRLAAVRGWDFDLFAHKHVENLSGLISYAIENNLVDDEDLCEIINDAFAYGQKFGGLDDEGNWDVPRYSKYRAEIYDPLWKLVVTIVKKEPPFLDLPATLACTIPVISNLAFHDLLLSISNHNFFDFISYSWKALRLVHYEAFAEYFPKGLEASPGLSKDEFAEGRMQSRYSMLSDKAKETELRELKVYRLAKELASFGNIPKKLSELKGQVIPGQIFKTFLNLENVSLPIGVKLPIIEELEGDPDYLPYKPPPVDKMIAALMEKIQEYQREMWRISENVANFSDKLAEIEVENAESREIETQIETRNAGNISFNFKALEEMFYVGLAIIVLFFGVILWKVW